MKRYKIPKELRDRAKAGDPTAQYEHAKALWKPTYIFNQEVREWLEKAADQGHVEAQIELGLFLEERPASDPNRPSNWQPRGQIVVG
jgi:TPR repeat protein